MNAGEYFWPIEGYYALTGTFGEFRYNHFHAGIDISTKGLIGLPIKAIENGYVYRIRTSPVGYGRAIYLLLADGNFAIYGHLSRFAPKIERWVQANQLKSCEFSLNAFPEPSSFPVKKGEVIGYSGDTGNVPPHLHFELRKKEDQPINPFHYFDRSLSDQTPPFIAALAINPMGVDSTVDETWETKIYQARWDNQRKHYYLPKNIYTWGECGIEVFTYDLSRGYQVGIHKIQLFVNGQLVSTLQYDSFFYREYRNNYWVVDRELFLKGKGKFQRLYRRPGDNLSFYFKTEGRDGILSTLSPSSISGLRPGKNYLKVIVENSGKKKRSLLFQLIAQPPFFQRKEKVDLLPKDFSDFNFKELKITSEIKHFEDFLVIETSTNYPPPLPPRCYFQQNGEKEKEIVLFSRSPKDYVGRYQIVPYLDGKAQARIVFYSPAGEKKEKVHSFTVQTISPKKGGTVVSADGLVRITIGPDEINEIMFPRVEKVPIKPCPRFLEPLSPAYQCKPLGVTFNSPGKITFRYPRSTLNPRQLAIFYWDRGTHWHYLSSRNDSMKKTITARIPFFAKFALMRDPFAPVIQPCFPSSGSYVKPDNIRFSARINDKGSGINYKKIFMLIDGNKVPAEYVPKRSTLFFVTPKPLKAGPHCMEIIASDLVGNRSKIKVAFNVV